MWRRWARFNLRGMLVVVTVLGVWLGRQVQWMRDRQEAREWIVEHESGGHLARDDADDFYLVTTLVNGARVTSRKAVPNAPWSIRIFRAPRVPFIHLDKGTLSPSDIPRINSLQVLFPEADGIQVEEPCWCTRWPPKDPVAFIRYPTRVVGGRLVNEPEPQVVATP